MGQHFMVTHVSVWTVNIVASQISSSNFYFFVLFFFLTTIILVEDCADGHLFVDDVIPWVCFYSIVMYLKVFVATRCHSDYILGQLVNKLQL